MSDNITEEMNDKTTEEMSDNTNKEMNDKTTEEMSDNTTKEMSDNTTKEMSDKTTGEMSDKTTGEWQEVNPQLVKLFNYHFKLAVLTLEREGSLCPIIAFIDHDEVASFTQNVRNPKKIPKLSECLDVVRNAKEGSPNVEAVAIIYCNDYNGKKVIQFDLDHRCGQCISIMVPYTIKGTGILFKRKVELADSKNYIIQQADSFACW